MKTILETLDGGTQWLEKKGIEDARRNMQLLICHQLDISKIQLYTRFDQPLDEVDLVPLREKLKLRGEGTPLQHLLGTVEFFRREYKTDGRALIPRPETEELVEIAIELANKKLTSIPVLIEESSETSNNDEENPQAPPEDLIEEEKPKFKILDMGCGSGVIGITLAAELGIRVEVTCADISEEALSLAKENSELLGINNVNFLPTNLFSNLETGENYDLVVANLPYVPDVDRPSLAPELEHDPDLALYGGEDGLDVIKIFIQQVRKHLNEQADIALEIGINQFREVEQLLSQAGFTDISTKQDLSGISRFPTARFITQIHQ
jgi:release factor glutamine methyltransferase|tara:strand:+ start:5453 stop:6418 length:966 start_codon:yes stop_codon:yes gene_type:complete